MYIGVLHMLYENIEQMDAQSRNAFDSQSLHSLVVAASGLSLKPIKRAAVGA